MNFWFFSTTSKFLELLSHFLKQSIFWHHKRLLKWIVNKINLKENIKSVDFNFCFVFVSKWDKSPWFRYCHICGEFISNSNKQRISNSGWSWIWKGNFLFNILLKIKQWFKFENVKIYLKLFSNWWLLCFEHFWEIKLYLHTKNIRLCFIFWHVDFMDFFDI